MPQLAKQLRRELPKSNTLDGRRDIVVDLWAPARDEIMSNKFLDENYREFAVHRAGYYAELLLLSYVVDDSDFEMTGDPARRAKFSLSRFDPATSRRFGLPLTEEEKFSSGLDDHNATERERLRIPLSVDDWRFYHESEQKPGTGKETSQVPIAPVGEVQPVGYSDAFDVTPGSRFSLSFDAGFGQTDRSSIQTPIRIELGAMFQRAISIDPGWNDSFSASGRIEVDLGPIFGDSPGNRASKRVGLNFGYLSSDAGGSIDFIEGGDDDPFSDGSALLDPGGLDGMFGGGGIKLVDNDIGFADHWDVRARSDYEALRVGLDVSNSYRFGDFQVRPRFGVYYGHTDEDVSITGTTGNGLVDYRYRNDLRSDRVGGEFALETKYQVTDDLRFTFTPRFGLSRVRADGESAVDVNVGDAPFASSSASGIDKTFTSFDYSLSGGVEYDLSGNATLSLQGTWGSAEDPALEYAPEERANIKSQRFDALTISLGARINF